MSRRSLCPFPSPLQRKALEELIVPLTLAFSNDKDEAATAEQVVIAYRDLDEVVRVSDVTCCSLCPEGGALKSVT